MDDEEIRLSMRRRVELATQYVEGFLAARAALLWQRALGVKLGNLLNTESSLTRG